MGPVIGTSLFVINTATPFVFAAAICLSGVFVLVFGYQDATISMRTTQGGFRTLISKLKIPLAAGASYAVIEVSMASFLMTSNPAKRHTEI